MKTIATILTIVILFGCTAKAKEEKTKDIIQGINNILQDSKGQKRRFSDGGDLSTYRTIKIELSKNKESLLFWNEDKTFGGYSESYRLEIPLSDLESVSYKKVPSQKSILVYGFYIISIQCKNKIKKYVSNTPSITEYTKTSIYVDNEKQAKKLVSLFTQLKDIYQ